MLSNQGLSQNAILYISSNFQDKYILQVIASKTNNYEYQLCLTDGKMYIGGRYPSTQNLGISMFSVVEVQCKFVSRWAPMQVSKYFREITSLKVLYEMDGLLGHPPTTLHDYFLDKKDTASSSKHASERGSDSQESGNELVRPRKKIKVGNSSSQKSSPIHSSQSPYQTQSQTQKFAPRVFSYAQNIQNNETQKFNFQKNDSQKSKSDNENLQIISESQQPQKQSQELIEQKQQKQQATQKVYMAESEDVIILKTKTISYQSNTTIHVCDLYQRMLRWKILCRVVDFRIFISAKKIKCLSMWLIDQKGDHIKAMYFYGNSGENPGQILSVGKNFFFSSGDIKKTDSGQLQIVLGNKSTIKQNEQVFIYPFNAKKISKFRNILQMDNQVTIIGIIKKYQILPALKNSYNGRPRIKGVICSPVEQCEIQFMKTLCQGQKQPQVQSIYVLNSFSVTQMQNALKLIGGSHGFMTKILNEDMNFLAQNYEQFKMLKKFKEAMGAKGIWKKIDNYNLSEIKFGKRTISQMKQIAKQTDSAIYSQILVSISDIKLKKQYLACPICKKATIQQEASFHQCLKCRKIVDPFQNIIIFMVLADSTGNFEIDVIGEKTQIFIGVDMSEFASMGQDDKQCTLQICRYSEFVVKIKSQRKSMKQFTHSLQNVDKQDHLLTMKQIKRRTIDHQLKIQSKWIQN